MLALLDEMGPSPGLEEVSMVAAPAFFTASAPSEQGKTLTARVVLGDVRGSTAVDVDGVRLGRRGIVFRFPWALEAGRHAWLEILLPSGKKIRPLVSVLGTADGGTSARIVHLFPEHQRALESYLASPSGY
jgi:hypothetical protein